MMYMSSQLPITKERAKKMPCLSIFLNPLPALQGPLFSARCSWASPSMKYSILRNTISISTVCGHSQPHHTRPNTAVNSTIMMKTVMSSRAKM